MSETSRLYGKMSNNHAEMSCLCVAMIHLIVEMTDLLAVMTHFNAEMSDLITFMSNSTSEMSELQPEMNSLRSAMLELRRSNTRSINKMSASLVQLTARVRFLMVSQRIDRKKALSKINLRRKPAVSLTLRPKY